MFYNPHFAQFLHRPCLRAPFPPSFSDRQKKNGSKKGLFFPLGSVTSLTVVWYKQFRCLCKRRGLKQRRESPSWLKRLFLGRPHHTLAMTTTTTTMASSSSSSSSPMASPIEGGKPPFHPISPFVRYFLQVSKTMDFDFFSPSRMAKGN